MHIAGSLAAFLLFLAFMKQKYSWTRLGIGLMVALSIHLFSFNEARVERYYSRGIYPLISSFLRFLLGWIPFSVGDVLYGAAVVWILVKAAKALRAVFKRELFRGDFVLSAQRTLGGLLLIYVSFNVLWGINYNRKGIAGQLGLPTREYSVNELKSLNAALLQRVNESNTMLQQQAPDSRGLPIFDGAQRAYREAEKKYPFLQYQSPSLKSSLWGWLGNYAGFLGYYNPFTGEGQVNTSVPGFIQPFTNCHEIAHQLGYAKESEANFVGYLAATASTDPAFLYSAYLDLFLYANGNLFYTDSLAAKGFAKQLLPAVKSDLKRWRQFNIQHKNPIEPVVRWMYGAYLQNNQQPSGILSYEEVTGFLVAYYKKYGKI